ncbi:MAG: polysaccharide lyase 8 family protein [Clostridiales bacterium]|jgi:hyaluronate lyase|nr:polysaccharide lyase 8 family protein [Clostridiales bacterium]
MDYPYLRERWASYLTGSNLDIDSPDTQEFIKSVERIAESDLGYATEPAFNGVYVSPYYTVAALAKAYKIHGTKQHGDPAVLGHVLGELERLHDAEFNVNAYHGNWWVLEIGIPKSLVDILILLHDEIGKTNVLKYTEVILRFKDEYIRNSGNPETGANLAWKCRILFLTGLLREDPALLEWVNHQLPKLMEYSALPDPGSSYDDGFYPDGTFIQHSYLHYTGGYGKNLLTTLAGLFYAFLDTGALAVPDECIAFIHKMAFDAYEPLIYKGRFLDIARGREVSRYFHQDYITGRHVIRGLCYLSETMPESSKLRARAMIREWLSSDDDLALLRDEDAHAEHFVYGSLLPIYRKIMKTAPREEKPFHKTFGIGADAVHHAKNYCFAVKMHSPDIASYEFLNGEGEKFWHISDGMTYLYTSDLDCFNSDYYATVDMQRLPGTTVDRSPDRASDPYYHWFGSDSKNPRSFAGGTDLGTCGAAGMHYKGQGLGIIRDLDAQKSWFMFDKEIVCLGSGISSSSGNPIETTVDNRRNSQVSSSGHIAHIQAKGAGTAYWFPANQAFQTLAERRKGTWNSVEIDPKFCKENNFATIWIDHGRNPENASYAYVVLPETSQAEAQKYASHPGIEILENSIQAHAVRHSRLSITAVNFWANHAVAGIFASAPCSLIFQQRESVCEIAISDPARSDSLIEVSFPFGATKALSLDKRLRIVKASPLTVRFDSAGTHRGTALMSVELE